MEKREDRSSFGGTQQVWRHHSTALSCQMNVAVYLPPQAQQKSCPVLYWLSGLTCSEQNFITKAGAQAYAAKHGVIIVAPDTSPRGDDVPDDDTYDLGQGAGFYINATQDPWAKHYQMFDYVSDELPKLIAANFPTTGQQSIMGHSMGGHGALMIALKRPDLYKSTSAFAPIVAPSRVPWGHKAFGAYLGDDQDSWQQWDTCHLLTQTTTHVPMLIDQGTEDDFLENQLQTQRLVDVCQTADYPATVRLQPGYDHSYYFIASFIGEHIEFHAKHLA